MARKLNEYVITKDGKDCNELPYDTVVGFSLAREEVKELSKKFPKYKWGARKIGTDYLS